MQPRKRFRVELDDRWPDWERWCANRGLRVGEGARRLIAAALSADAESSGLDAQAPVRPSTSGASFVRVEIRLTPAEREVVERRAAALGLSKNRWIVALIRAQSLEEPHFNAQEMRLLSESNQQLAMINRYLAPIARSALANGVEWSALSGTEAIRERVDAHLRIVAAMVRANLDRWRE